MLRATWCSGSEKGESTDEKGHLPGHCPADLRAAGLPGILCWNEGEDSAECVGGSTDVCPEREAAPAHTEGNPASGMTIAVEFMCAT